MGVSDASEGFASLFQFIEQMRRGAAVGTMRDATDDPVQWLNDLRDQVYNPTVHVSQFGASSTATAAVNVAAFNQAIDRLPAAGTNRLCVCPTGTGGYQINDEFTAPANTYVVGAGPASKIVQTVNDKNIFIAGDDTTFDGLYLEGDNAATAGVSATKNHGIYGASVTGVTVRNCWFTKCEGSGIRFNNVDNAKIVDSWFWANPWGTFASASDILLFGLCNRVIISRNHCLSNNSQGIYVNATAGDTDIVVSDNICVTMDTDGTTLATISTSNSVQRRHGIIVGYSTGAAESRCVVANNICGNTAWTGIYCQSGTQAGPLVVTGNLCWDNGYELGNSLAGSILADISSRGSIVANNVCVDFKSTDTSASLRVQSTAAQRLAVEHNWIINSAFRGLQVTTSTRNVVVGYNHFYTNADHDIRVNLNSADATLGDITLVGNRIFRDSGTDKAGIYFDQQAGTVPSLIADNVIVGDDNTTNDANNSGIRVASDPQYVRVVRNQIRNFYHGVYTDTLASARMFDEWFIDHNHFEDCNTGIRANANTDGCYLFEGNTFKNCTNLVSHTAKGFLGQRVGSLMVAQGTAAPTTGTFITGDRVLDTAPSASGKIGWVCTTAGAPGTWKAYGAIDA